MRLVSDRMGTMTDCFRTRRIKPLGMLHGEEWCRVTDVSEELGASIFMVDWAVHRDSSEHFNTGLADDVGNHLLGLLLL